MNTIDHKSTVETLRKAVPGAKLHFSKSPRNKGREFWAIKCEANAERNAAIETLVTEGTVAPWQVFWSKDKSTTGLYVIVNSDGTAV